MSPLLPAGTGRHVYRAIGSAFPLLIRFHQFLQTQDVARSAMVIKRHIDKVRSWLLVKKTRHLIIHRSFFFSLLNKHAVNIWPVFFCEEIRPLFFSLLLVNKHAIISILLYYMLAPPKLLV